MTDVCDVSVVDPKSIKYTMFYSDVHVTSQNRHHSVFVHRPVEKRREPSADEDPIGSSTINTSYLYRRPPHSETFRHVVVVEMSR